MSSDTESDYESDLELPEETPAAPPPKVESKKPKPEVSAKVLAHMENMRAASVKKRQAKAELEKKEKELKEAEEQAKKDKLIQEHEEKVVKPKKKKDETLLDALKEEDIVVELQKARQQDPGVSKTAPVKSKVAFEDIIACKDYYKNKYKKKYAPAPPPVAQPPQQFQPIPYIDSIRF